MVSSTSCMPGCYRRAPAPGILTRQVARGPIVAAPPSTGGPPMRRFAVIGMALALAVGLAACSSSSKPATAATRPRRRPRPARRRRRAARRPIPAAAANFKPVVGRHALGRHEPARPGLLGGQRQRPDQAHVGLRVRHRQVHAEDVRAAEVQRAQRELRRDRRRHGHQLRPRALAGLDHARAGQGRLVLRAVLRVAAGRAHAAGREHHHARRGQDHQLGRADRRPPRSTC